MAQPANTHDRYDLATTGDNVRDALADMITNISPTETPFMSAIGSGGATSSDYTEWLVDSLAAASTSNAHIDGNDFAGEAMDAAEKLGNYCQISKKQLVVTRRANKVNKAGRKSEMAYQLLKKGKELRIDQEAILTRGQVAAAGNATTAPTTAALAAWIKTNTARGVSGTDPVLSSTTYGYPDTAVTDGTTRALSEATLLGVIQSAWTAGGNPDLIMVGAAVKQKISQYLFGSTARVATQYQDQGGSVSGGVKVAGAVDYYVSDFGTFEIRPNRNQRERDVFVLDTSMFSVKHLDNYKTEDIAKTGDSVKKQILVDYCLCSKQEASSGVVADINETLAMVA